MTIGTLWRAAGLGLALGLFGAGDPLQAQTACGTGTGYQPSNETGHKATDDADWCGRTKEYWDEILGHAANKGSCQAGRRQSPIALVTPQSRDIGLFPITFVYSSGQGTRELKNNGHTVELRLYQYLDSFMSRIEINERNYVLDRMHFHYPSEHTLDGERFPLELHLVHGNNEDWSVFALLVRKDPNDKVNQELNNLFRDMPTEKDKSKTITVEGKDVIGLLPENKRYLSYKGSLTTPGCNEGITWVVFTTPITASQAQINKFKAAITYDHPFKVNARPLNDGQGSIRTSEGRSVGLWE